VNDKDLHTYGFLGYPILQTADIVMYCEAGRELIVPVGEDQKSHVELGREIVRRFNLFYGLKIDEILRDPSRAWVLGEMQVPLRSAPLHPGVHAFPLNDADWAETKRKMRARILEVGLDNAFSSLKKIQSGAEYITLEHELQEPEVMLTHSPRIPGLDGRKMSKSYGNAITLSESDADIRAKTKVMVTDPARKRRTDPGNPDVCPVYDWHKLFSPPETLKWAAEGCRSAGIGCIECKAAMADNLSKWITPVRARREEYAAHPGKVLQILDAGSAKAREVAQKTMSRVREAVFNWKDKRAEIAM
jgi:tryptophanyl-tRNA synthetase